MRAILRGVAGFASLAVLCGGAFCQTEEDLELKLFRPRLEIAADSFPSREFEDAGDGEFGNDTVRLNVNIPLGTTHVRPQKRVLAYQFLALANFSSGSPDIRLISPSFQGQDHRLYTGVLAFGAVMLGRSKNLFAVAAGTSVAEDQDTLDSPSGRFWGAGIATHRFGEKSTLIYGGLFAHTFGRGILLPIIGGSWRLNPKWTLTALAPFNVAARFAATDRIAVRIRTGPAGNRFRFSNENQSEFGAPGSQPEIVYLRIVQWRTTGEIEWKVSDDVALLAQAGWTRTTRFEFADNSRGEDAFFDDKTGQAPYVKVAARFLFGKTILDDWKD